MRDSGRRCILLCPEYYDGRLNGIGRVSELTASAMEALGFHLEIWSANEEGDCFDAGGHRFGRNYFRMLFQALMEPITDVGAIVCMHAGLSPVARLLAFRAGCPYNVFFHGVDVWERLKARTRWGIAGARYIVSVSDFTLKQCLRSNPDLRRVKSSVMPLGLMGGGVPALEIQGIRSSGGKVLLVTRLTKHCRGKNVRQLILAMRHVRAVVPSATLTIVGEGDDREDLEKFALHNASQLTINFLGRIPDDELAGVYAESDVFAMPSDQEGFGLVFVEAMARGLACVCGNRDASREVVDDKVTGLAVDPDSPEAIGDVIIRLLLNDRLRHDMGVAGWQRYRQFFTGEAVRLRLDQVLTECFVLCDSKGKNS